jgi:hypothetical protein
MAEMAPDRLPGKASTGEEVVFELLKKLPEDCIVYYEPTHLDISATVAQISSAGYKRTVTDLAVSLLITRVSEFDSP